MALRCGVNNDPYMFSPTNNFDCASGPLFPTKWFILQVSGYRIERGLFLDPFYWSVRSAGGRGGVVVVRHETEIVDMNMRIEKSLQSIETSQG